MRLSRWRGRALPAAWLFLVCTVAQASDAATDQIEQGRRIYNFRCYFCHGYSGDAATVAAAALQPRPRNFQTTARSALPLPRINQVVRDGIAGTAMRPFAKVLTATEIDAVARFIDSEFLQKRARNTRYHTDENGWPDHQRYRVAYPFVLGDIPLSRAMDTLSADEQRGRRLFVTNCITCHDRGGADGGPVWSRVN